MKALFIEPKQEPIVIEIENELKELQKAVNGLIEYCSNYSLYNDIQFICNEEGKLMGYEPTIDFGYDVLVGPVLVFGIAEDYENKSLTNEQIEKYTELFSLKNRVW